MIRALARAALGVTALTATLVPAHAAKWPEWADLALAEFCVECYEDEEAAVVLEEWDLRLRAGERRGTMRRVVHVYSEEGIDKASVVLASSPFRRYDNVRVWVRSASGDVGRYTEEDGTLFGAGEQNMLDDTQVLLLAPPGLRPGSTLAVESEVVRTADWPQDLFVPQGRIPVARVTVSIDARKGWRVVAAVAGMDNPGPGETTGEARWIFEDLPALPTGWRGLAPRPPTIALALNYTPPDGSLPFATWQSTARWFAERFSLPREKQPTLERWSAGLAASGRDPVEEAGRLARSVRYFAVELGWGAFIPRTPEHTLTRAFGDCKDKTQVMLALLRDAGIEAYPVLAVSPTTQFVHDDLPSPGVFNHVIAGIPWTGRESRPGMTIVEDSELGPMRLYDATIGEGSALDIALQLQGGAGLILHPRTTRVLRFPGSSLEDNQYHKSHRLRVSEDGAVVTETTVRAYGVLREFLESETGAAIDAAELRRRVYERLAIENPELIDLRVESVRSEDDGAWVYGVSYTSPHRLADFGDLKLLDLESVAPAELLPLAEEDDEVIYTALQVVLRSTYEVDLGDWSLVGEAESFSVENDVGKVEMRFDRDGSALTLERAVTLAASKLTSVELEQVSELRDALRRINGAALVLESR